VAQVQAMFRALAAPGVYRDRSTSRAGRRSSSPTGWATRCSGTPAP